MVGLHQRHHVNDIHFINNLMNKLFLLIFTLFFCHISFPQCITEEITWSKERKLTWDDYLGHPQGNVGAASYCNIFFENSLKGDTLSIISKSIFVKKKSWVKNNYKTSLVLNHEQTHFDLTEVYVRKLKKALYEYKFKKETAIENCKRLCNEFIMYWDKEDALYDQEIDLSKYDKEVQQKWSNKTTKELEELEKYSNQELIIIF